MAKRRRRASAPAGRYRTIAGPFARKATQEKHAARAKASYGAARVRYVNGHGSKPYSVSVRFPR